MRILGYFPSLKAANEAFKMVRAEGAGKAYVDVKNSNNDITNSLPGTSLRTSISEPISNAPTFTNANSSNTNQIDGSVNNNDFNYTLVVDANEVNINSIKNIISEMGGIVQEDTSNSGLK